MPDHTRQLSDELTRLDPYHRIAELEIENTALRRQRDSEIAGRLFAEELIARGARPPRGTRYMRDGSFDG
jgi:hypothetical protein